MNEIEKEGRLAKDFPFEEMLPEIVALMAEVGFDVNMTVCSSGLRPLVYAAHVGHE